MFYEQFDSPEELQAYCDRVLATQGRKAYEQQCGCGTSHLERKSSMSSTFDQHYQQASRQYSAHPESPEMQALRKRKEQLQNESRASMKRLQDMGAGLALGRLQRDIEEPWRWELRRSMEKMDASLDRLRNKATLFVTGVALDRAEANAVAQDLRTREALSYRVGGSFIE